MKMSIMLFVVFFSVTMLDKRYSLFQYLSLAVVIVGLLIVTIVDIRQSEDYDNLLFDGEAKVFSSEEHLVIIGMLCLLGGQLFMALLVILEEHILTLGQEPLNMVGWKGVFGCAITSVLLVAA